MTAFSKYQVRYDDQCCTVILFIEPGNANEEFASELGTKDNLRQEASRFIKDKLQFISVKTVKIMVGPVLVVSFTFGGVSPIFAATNTATLSEVQNEVQVLEQASEVTATTPDASTGQSGTEATPAATTEPSPANANTPAETTPADPSTAPDPGLVPGDFFYFVKILSEKIELALTFDDVRKAQLLAEFAGKRVAEAQELLSAGDTTGATALLNQALEHQELALNYTENSGIPSLDGTTTDPVTVNPDGTTPQDSTAAPTDTAPLTEEQKALLEVRDQLQTQFALNIIALMTALQKVDNAEAKAELTDNIQESFVKLEKQLGKLDKIRNETDRKEIGSKIADLREDIQDDAEDIQEEIQDAVAAPDSDDEEDEQTSGVTSSPSPAAANKKQNLEKRAEQKREAAGRPYNRDDEQADLDEEDEEDEDNKDNNERQNNRTEAVNRKDNTPTSAETRVTHGGNQGEKQKNTSEQIKEQRRNDDQKWKKNKEDEAED